jgi:hypothetical protein
MANRIEEALGLQAGWMDTDHTKVAPTQEQDEDLAALLDSVSGLYQQSPEATRAALIKVMGAIVTGKPIESLVENGGNK